MQHLFLISSALRLNRRSARFGAQRCRRSGEAEEQSSSTSTTSATLQAVHWQETPQMITDEQVVGFTLDWRECGASGESRASRSTRSHSSRRPFVQKTCSRSFHKHGVLARQPHFVGALRGSRCQARVRATLPQLRVHGRKLCIPLTPDLLQKQLTTGSRVGHMARITASKAWYIMSTSRQGPCDLCVFECRASSQSHTLSVRRGKGEH